MCKVYNYARVSSKDQNVARQEEAFETWCKENNIDNYTKFVDKMSGKNFERNGYQELIKQLKKGDLVVIKSIDRLGRNYDLIIEEWTRITKTIGADIVVLDMPLLDTRSKKDNLTGKFISDIVLQLLSYVAETERNNIRQRQREGIDLALANGTKFGREKTYNYNEIKCEYDNGTPYAEITSKLGISKSRIIRIAQEQNWKPRNKKKSQNKD